MRSRKAKIWAVISAAVFLVIFLTSWFIVWNWTEEKPAETENETTPIAQSRIVVKVKPSIQLPYQDNAEQSLNQEHKSSFPSDLKLKKLFTSADPKQLQSMQQQTNKSQKSDDQVDLLRYFVVDVPQGSNPDELAQQLAKSQFVETAYVEGIPVIPPAVNPNNDPLSPNQGYLNPAPNGINAKFAWNHPGGDGTNVTVADLEQGWNLSHQDLIAQNISIISGLSRTSHSHGTSVLGELVSTDNTVGTVGIVPHATAKVVSQWRTNSIYSTADAILSAAQNLAKGDVLLLEAQTTYPTMSNYLPVEVEDAVYDAIRFATNKGITVVEAAGNGSNNLDNFRNQAGKYILNRNHANFRDSGAIMVGAASSSVPHARLSFSNYGSRIDCYGWGQNVTTTTGNVGQNTSYTHSFSGTSSASPIIAGAAASLNGITKAGYNGFTYSPADIRTILKYSSFSTPSASANDRIGRMPNLKAITEYVLRIESNSKSQNVIPPKLPIKE
ncbi:S8 family peptidase [Thermoactinomyces sp. DSM 45892]|uniref:S8 family peptidase n=1 Tax=Thermoactinomyces sp. DSM 45892 TaxID=1882753 RepID=UPI000899643E|nr:S8 family peptidase [Thermoactinomyces sp. DSM 45892]SDZ37430.1 Subtilase family protein [Thermoactinomyces sp. DSM 45892]